MRTSCSIAVTLPGRRLRQALPFGCAGRGQRRCRVCPPGPTNTFRVTWPGVRRPAPALGLHEYDGKLTDYSGASVEAELRRLKSFAERLAALNTNGLSTGAFYDYRILRSAVQRETFSFDGMDIYRQNPMTYAGALDASIYIKRDFAPLETRARSVFAMLNQAPPLFAAARANLAAELPRPEVETAIDQTEGIADFLAKDLVAALKEVKDDKLMERVQGGQPARH